jgi:DNA-binding NarL/FixJ family response regulator
MLLTDTDIETLRDVAEGLSDKGISGRRHISVRTVQARLDKLRNKLGLEADDEYIYNLRTRLIALAVQKGCIEVSALYANLSA